MITTPVRERPFDNEFKLSASRSSGPGGQNVNKVSTKIELRFNVHASILLSIEEKEILFRKLASRINQEGELLVVAQSERSQLQNKEMAIEKFLSLIETALKPVIKRKATKPTHAAQLKRLEHKKLLSQKKANRKNFDTE